MFSKDFFRSFLGFGPIKAECHAGHPQTEQEAADEL